MSDLNINHQQKEDVLQPQFIRTHHSFRSPMDSEDLNLEINQFRFDLVFLYKAFGDLLKTLEEKMAVLHSDIYTLPNSLSIKVNEAIQTQLSFVFNSMNSISTKLEKIQYRIDILEKGLQSA